MIHDGLAQQVSNSYLNNTAWCVDTGRIARELYCYLQNCGEHQIILDLLLGHKLYLKITGNKVAADAFSRSSLPWNGVVNAPRE
jgi:hypothetical protein